MNERTVVRMVFGSHVYGTNTPQSDRDWKTVFVPSARAILLQRATKVSRSRSTGDPHGKNTAADVDSEEFSLHGYLKLLCEGQTVAVDMLFVPGEHVTESSETWERIQESRGHLVSRSIAPFVGYCRAGRSAPSRGRGTSWGDTGIIYVTNPSPPVPSGVA